MENYDFSGWATRANLKCSDGKTIMKDAFKDCDGQQVPLVWSHQHDNPYNVLGHAILENRDEGVYAYCYFNDTETGQNAKELVVHKDITALSIYANQLKKDSGNNVHHGVIREVSLVYAGANPGALIDSVIAHSDDEGQEFEATIYTGEAIELYHADDSVKSEGEKEKMAEETKKPESEEKEEGKTVKEVWETLNEEQKELVYAIVAASDADDDKKDDEKDNKEDKEGEKEMKHNVFDKDNETNSLSHADQESIIAMAKSSSCGSLRDAIASYAETNKNVLAHGIDSITELFPEFKLVKSGAPELLTDDQSWVNLVLTKIHKSPISRIRTRQAEARRSKLQEALRAKGYKKAEEKKIMANIKLLSRTTDPQTIYVKDEMNRDDIIDITDFDVVNYQYGIMRMALNEELARAIMIGDGREAGEDKISEDHIRPIYGDDDLYTVYYDVDLAGTRANIQGKNTSLYFGEDYIYAEAVVQAALYSRKQYKGTGTPDFYTTTTTLNKMLLARDRNGRRIYDSKADLARALNVGNIVEVEVFEDVTRSFVVEGTGEAKVKKLVGLFVNLVDYQIGSTKGGEITNFNQFDIDFNKQKYLIETRVSGALVKVQAAVALEEDITPAAEEEAPGTEEEEGAE